MAAITWREDFATGIEAIDGQHYRLFSLADQVTLALGEVEGHLFLARAFAEPIQYASVHFGDE